MKKKKIATCVLLSIVTLGIYTLFWGTDLLFETDKLDKSKHKTSVLWKIVYSIVTGGIYLIYWAWHSGKTITQAHKKMGDNALLYALLMFVTLVCDFTFIFPIYKTLSFSIGFSFVFLLILMSLIQIDLNKLIDLKVLK